MEEIAKRVEIPCAIIRANLACGEGDLRLNNTVWTLRHFPVFPIFRNGE